MTISEEKRKEILSYIKKSDIAHKIARRLGVDVDKLPMCATPNLVRATLAEILIHGHE